MSAAHQKAVLSRRSVSSDSGAVARAASEIGSLGSVTAATMGRHDIRRVALSASVNGRSRPVQRAMNVSQPGDPSEMEADRVADSVMRMQDAPSPVSRSQATVSREGEEEEEVQAKLLDGAAGGVQAISRQVEVAREGEEEEEVQTKRLDTASRDAVAREGAEEEEEVATKRVSRSESADVENGGDVSHIVKQGLSGGGQPLDSASRAFFEPRLGHDLSSIRIHTGEQASSSAEQVNARAYAVGGDIAFKSGEYNPGTSAGKHLLAHELTHTVQQGATTPLAPSRKSVSRRKK